jgi:citrate lyase subunit beta/citryl-CoA lyase
MDGRKSVLCVPGGDERMIGKALRAGADEVVVDLEDSVAPADKDRARDLLGHAVARRTGASRLAVRVNAVGSRWCHSDIAAAVAAGADSIVLPKVDSAADLTFADRLVSGLVAAADLPADAGPGLQALIETAAGLGRVGEIAGATPRLRALILGYADLGVSLGRAAEIGPALWAPVQDRVLVAARTCGVDAVDGPYLGVAVDEKFLAAIDHGARVGFDGKWAIHPRQIEPINAAFSPSDAEVARARRVIGALTAAHRGGRGAVDLDGDMIDEAVAAAARRTLAKAGLRS